MAGSFGSSEELADENPGFTEKAGEMAGISLPRELPCLSFT
jgi:hypothetical protein